MGNLTIPFLQLYDSQRPNLDLLCLDFSYIQQCLVAGTSEGLIYMWKTCFDHKESDFAAQLGLHKVFTHFYGSGISHVKIIENLNHKGATVHALFCVDVHGNRCCLSSADGSTLSSTNSTLPFVPCELIKLETACNNLLVTIGRYPKQVCILDVLGCGPVDGFHDNSTDPNRPGSAVVVAAKLHNADVNQRAILQILYNDCTMEYFSVDRQAQHIDDKLLPRSGSRTRLNFLGAKKFLDPQSNMRQLENLMGFTTLPGTCLVWTAWTVSGQIFYFDLSEDGYTQLDLTHQTPDGCLTNITFVVLDSGAIQCIGVFTPELSSAPPVACTLMFDKFQLCPTTAEKDISANGNLIRDYFASKTQLVNDTINDSQQKKPDGALLADHQHDQTEFFTPKKISCVVSVSNQTSYHLFLKDRIEIVFDWFDFRSPLERMPAERATLDLIQSFSNIAPKRSPFQYQIKTHDPHNEITLMLDYKDTLYLDEFSQDHSQARPPTIEPPDFIFGTSAGHILFETACSILKHEYLSIRPDQEGASSNLFKAHSSEITDLLTFHRNGKTYLLSASQDCKIKIWELFSYKCLSTISFHIGHITHLAFLTRKASGNMDEISAPSELHASDSNVDDDNNDMTAKKRKPRFAVSLGKDNSVCVIPLCALKTAYFFTGMESRIVCVYVHEREAALYVVTEKDYLYIFAIRSSTVLRIVKGKQLISQIIAKIKHQHPLASPYHYYEDPDFVYTKHSLSPSLFIPPLYYEALRACTSESTSSRAADPYIPLMQPMDHKHGSPWKLLFFRNLLPGTSGLVFHFNFTSFVHSLLQKQDSPNEIHRQTEILSLILQLLPTKKQMTEDLETNNKESGAITRIIGYTCNKLLSLTPFLFSMDTCVQFNSEPKPNLYREGGGGKSSGNGLQISTKCTSKVIVASVLVQYVLDKPLEKINLETDFFVKHALSEKSINAVPGSFETLFHLYMQQDMNPAIESLLVKLLQAMDKNNLKAHVAEWERQTLHQLRLLDMSSKSVQFDFYETVLSYLEDIGLCHALMVLFAYNTISHNNSNGSGNNIDVRPSTQFLSQVLPALCYLVIGPKYTTLSTELSKKYALVHAKGCSRKYDIYTYLVYKTTAMGLICAKLTNYKQYINLDFFVRTFIDMTYFPRRHMINMHLPPQQHTDARLVKDIDRLLLPLYLKNLHLISMSLPLTFASTVIRCFEANYDTKVRVSCLSIILLYTRNNRQLTTRTAGFDIIMEFIVKCIGAGIFPTDRMEMSRFLEHFRRDANSSCALDYELDGFHRIGVVLKDEILAVYQCQSGKMLFNHPSKMKHVDAIALNAEACMLAAFSVYDRQIVIYNIRNVSSLLKIFTGSTGPVVKQFELDPTVGQENHANHRYYIQWVTPSELILFTEHLQDPPSDPQGGSVKKIHETFRL